MSEDISFADLLDSKASDHKRAPTLPQGIYIFCVGPHKFDKSSQKQTPYVRYELKLISPDDGVDVGDIPFDGRNFRADFYLTGKAAYRLTEFLRKCGVEVEERTFAEVIPEATGCEIKAYLLERPSRDPGSDETYNEVGSFYAM